MVHISVTKGLDIPILGAPEGAIREKQDPSLLALDLTPFPDTAFKLLVKAGDQVLIGSPLAADKQCLSRLFVSPAAGTVQEILRGDKRKLHYIVIARQDKEEQLKREPLSPQSATREQLTQRLLEGGIFTRIHSRPFSRLADPNRPPRSIFIKALESAPFTPASEMQIQGLEAFFHTGLIALQKLTEGSVNLVYRQGSSCTAFTDSSGTPKVKRHTVSGPHPASNPSLHIQRIDPINSTDDIVWVISSLDVARIGRLLETGEQLTHRIVGIGGPACQLEHRGFFRVRDGAPLDSLFEGGVLLGEKQWISGDPLMGNARTPEEYLGFFHTSASLFMEQETRTMLHFFRLGKNSYTASRTYLSGHSRDPNKRYPFTTAMHGEPRALITNLPYEGVMPLRIPTLPLVRAVMAEDYEQAEQMGLLEVASEDFALPTFVCPSKVEMVEIIRKGLHDYAAQVLPQG